MVERRSMGSALSFTPDKMAFIQKGTATPPPDPMIELKHEAPAAITASVTRPEVETTAVEETSGRSRRANRTRNRRQARSEPSHVSIENAFPGLANILVPLTTRLHPVTANALRRAGLEQRLRGQQPATVQEIAEEAIQDWLRDSGYLE